MVGCEAHRALLRRVAEDLGVWLPESASVGVCSPDYLPDELHPMHHCGLSRFWKFWLFAAVRARLAGGDWGYALGRAVHYAQDAVLLHDGCPGAELAEYWLPLKRHEALEREVEELIFAGRGRGWRGACVAGVDESRPGSFAEAVARCESAGDAVVEMARATACTLEAFERLVAAYRAHGLRLARRWLAYELLGFLSAGFSLALLLAGILSFSPLLLAAAAAVFFLGFLSPGDVAWDGFALGLQGAPVEPEVRRVVYLGFRDRDVVGVLVHGRGWVWFEGPARPPAAPAPGRRVPVA